MKRLLLWVGGVTSGLALLGVAFSLATVQSYNGTGLCLNSGMPLDGCAPQVTEISVWLPLASAPALDAEGLLALALLAGLPVWLILALRGERRGSSPRAPIMLSALLATGMLIVVAFILSSQGSLLAMPSVCYGGVNGATSACYTGARAYLLALAGVGGPAILGALVIGAPAWVMTLVRAARLRQWGWFVAALFLAPVAPLLYSAFGFEVRRVAPSRPAAFAPAAE